MSTFNAKLRALMQAQGWTQTALAEAIGTRQSVLFRWLQHDQPPKPVYLLRLARTLDVPVDFLIDPLKDEPDQDLSPDERTLLQFVRDLRLDRAEATRRLAGLPSQPPAAVPTPPAPAPAPPAPAPSTGKARRSPRKD